MNRICILFLAISSSAAALGEESLGRGIPSDYFFYLRRTANPAWEARRPELERLAGSLRSAIPARDAAEMALALLGQKPAADEVEGWERLLGDVDWTKLLRREAAFGLHFELDVTDAARLASTFHLDWLALFRVDRADRDPLLGQLRKVVLAIGSLEENGGRAKAERRRPSEVIEAERDGAATTILIENGEVALAVGAQEDVIAVSSSAWEMRRSFQLLAGRGSGLGISEGEDFRALMGLPPPEDGELVLRSGLIFESLRATQKAVEKVTPRDPDTAESMEEVLRALRGIIDTFDLVRGVAVSETYEGRRVVESFRIAFAEEASRRGLYGALADRPSLGDFARRVPASASGFLVTAGIDLERVESSILDFIRKALPEGRLTVDQYRQTQERAGFDLKRDVLSLIEGRAIYLTFPPSRKDQAPGANADPPAGGGAGQAPAGPAPGGPGDRVLLVRLKDPARAEAKLGEWLDKATETLRAMGMGLQPVELSGVSGRFRKAALPFPPGMEIVFGIHTDLFAAGTSRDRLVEAILATEGKGETVLANPLYKGLDLQPAGDPGTVWFRDLGGFLEEARSGLKALQLAGSMVPEGEPALALARKLLVLAPRLDPVLRALGFFEAQGGFVARDGNGYRGRMVIGLRPVGWVPKEPAAPKTEEKPGEPKKRTF